MDTPNPVERVLELLKGVHPSGEGWGALCPAHDDSRPSLSISRGSDGRALVACHAGCDIDAIVAALGISKRDLFPEANGNGANTREKWELIAKYPYLDEGGALLYTKLRYRLPNGEKEYRYKPKMRGKRRIPYRLDLLVKSSEKAIVVAEGEKCCDALRRVGVLATTNPNGASKGKSKWTELDEETVKKVFTGRDVIILPDNDEPGRKHAQGVASSLFPIAKSVSIFEIPGLAEAADVADWIEERENAGKKAEEIHAELQKLIEPVEPIAEAPPTPKGQLQPDSRVRVCVNEGDLETLTQTIWRALKWGNDPVTLFRHAGVPARVERDDTGALGIQILEFQRMRCEAARRIQFYKIVKDGDIEDEIPDRPPGDAIGNLLATPDPDLPVLTRIVAVPIFAPDGSLVTAPGYHKGARVYLDVGDLEIPPVPERPTVEDVDGARDLLLDDLLGDFPFLGDADLAHVLALLLLPFTREMIQGPTPLHLIEKPSPGTGAGLLVDVLSIVATGRPAAVLTEGDDEDEWRKRLTSALMSSPAILMLDNLRRRLDSAALSSALTASTWTDRLLGKTQMLKIPVRCAWVAAGNNPATSTEIARRSVPVRLDAQVDRPWERRGFRHPDLARWARRHRGDLVRAALIVVRAWIVAGKPVEDGRRLGSFEDWSDIMRGILTVAQVPGFLGNLPEFYARADQEGAAWRAFVAAWWTKFRDTEVGVADLWKLLDTGEALLDLGKGSDRAQKTRLGYQLQKTRDRRFGGLKVEYVRDAQRLARYRLVLDRVEREPGGGQPFPATGNSATAEAEAYRSSRPPLPPRAIEAVHADSDAVWSVEELPGREPGEEG
jgi:putative DNA primase/helicase